MYMYIESSLGPISLEYRMLEVQQFELRPQYKYFSQKVNRVYYGKISNNERLMV